MPQKSTKRTGTEENAAPKEESRSPADQSRRRRLTIAAIAAAVVVVIVGGVAIYLDRIAPFRTTVISVNDEGISMRTFLRRIRISGEDPMVMLATLADEQIIKQVAPTAPYSIEVSESDIDDFLRNVASAGGEMSDEEFQAWYRQQVNESLMREAEFREIVRARLLRAGLHDYLAEQVPTVAAQVHLFIAPFEGLAAANEAKARIEAGETFAAVAADASSEPSVRTGGGDMGWQARDGLIPGIASIAFDRLEVGEVSEPYYIDGETFALISISDRAAAREIDERARQRIQERVIDEWLAREQGNHDVQYHGFTGPYNAQTDAWVRWQLEQLDR